MNRRLFLFCLVLVLAANPLAAQREPGLPSATVHQIEQAVTAHQARHSIPGLSVAVATQNQLRWSAGFGMADLENFVPAKASTVYRLGSIAKPITAVAAMQLVERGKLDLDAPVQKYVPSFPRKPWPLTSRQLLGHLGGVRHYRGEEISITRHYPTLLEGLGIFQDDALLFEPGTRYSYSTYGYNLLGVVVESASGMKFVDYLRENIFGPARMDRMGADEQARIIPNRSRGYRRTPAGTIENCGLADTSYKIPGGGLLSTAEDLAKFAMALQTGVLLKKETTAVMWTRQRTRQGQMVDYGLGWAIREADGRRTIGHGGAQQGTNTFLLLEPASELVVAVMCNLEAAAPQALAEQVAAILKR